MGIFGRCFFQMWMTWWKNEFMTLPADGQPWCVCRTWPHEHDQMWLGCLNCWISKRLLFAPPGIGPQEVSWNTSFLANFGVLAGVSFYTSKKALWKEAELKSNSLNVINGWYVWSCDDNIFICVSGMQLKPVGGKKLMGCHLWDTHSNLLQKFSSSIDFNQCFGLWIYWMYSGGL